VGRIRADTLSGSIGGIGTADPVASLGVCALPVELLELAID
jgi:hypothetical protein